MTKALLTVNHLKVQMQTSEGIIQPVDDVSFSINQGEILALVGESGCGKTITALSVNGLLPNNAYLCQGSEIFLQDIALHQLCENQMRRIRGKKIGMIFQDPALALNPVLTIGQQVKEAFYGGNGDYHDKEQKQIKNEIISLFDKVRIPSPASFLDLYPHQLSGGMKQRVVIAMALAQSPALLIADEPTTALDVTTQAQVLSLIKDLNKQLNMAILIITHDLGIVGKMADTVAVMYAGHFLEKASKEAFFASPKHPYSKKLFAALPELTAQNQKLEIIRGQVPALDRNFPLCRFKERCAYVFSGCEKSKPQWLPVDSNQQVRCHWYDQKEMATLPLDLRLPNIEKLVLREKNMILHHDIQSGEQPVLKVEDLKVHFPIRKGIFRKVVDHVKAVDSVSFNIWEGQTLALVGESGSGKTTVGKAIVRLIEATSGQVQFQNQNIFKLSNRKLREFRSHFQMIFQDPYSSMDPRMQVGQIIEEGMLALNIGSDHSERQDRIAVLLEQVGLSLKVKSRYPHQLSGGQRQRVAIARALAVGAQLIICDEPTSALDLSVQAQILNLLKKLQEELVISYLFITHNIGVVRYIADHVAVMYQGKIVEYGPTESVLNQPQHPYTRQLLDSVPFLEKEGNEMIAASPDEEMPVKRVNI